MNFEQTLCVNYGDYEKLPPPFQHVEQNLGVSGAGHHFFVTVKQFPNMTIQWQVLAF